MTPDVFTRRVALIASIAATWTFENVTTAEVYDGKLPEGAAKRFADRIRPIIDEIEGLSTAPPDGAAEREAPDDLDAHPFIEPVSRLHAEAMRRLGREKEAGDALRIKHAEGWIDALGHAIGMLKLTAMDKPTPAPTEAPAAGDGEAAIATRMALCREFVAQQSASSEWKDGAATGFYAGWNAALAARPAAVTEAMVEAAARVWHGDGSWESFPPSTIAAYRQSCRKALTAALAAGAAP